MWLRQSLCQMSLCWREGTGNGATMQKDYMSCSCGRTSSIQHIQCCMALVCAFQSRLCWKVFAFSDRLSCCVPLSGEEMDKMMPDLLYAVPTWAEKQRRAETCALFLNASYKATPALTRPQRHRIQAR